MANQASDDDVEISFDDLPVPDLTSAYDIWRTTSWVCVCEATNFAEDFECAVPSCQQRRVLPDNFLSGQFYCLCGSTDFESPGPICGTCGSWPHEGRVVDWMCRTCGRRNQGEICISCFRRFDHEAPDDWKEKILGGVPEDGVAAEEGGSFGLCGICKSELEGNECDWCGARANVRGLMTQRASPVLTGSVEYWQRLRPPTPQLDALSPSLDEVASLPQGQQDDAESRQEEVATDADSNGQGSRTGSAASVQPVAGFQTPLPPDVNPFAGTSAGTEPSDLSDLDGLRALLTPPSWIEEGGSPLSPRAMSTIEMIIANELPPPPAVSPSSGLLTSDDDAYFEPLITGREALDIEEWDIDRKEDDDRDDELL